MKCLLCGSKATKKLEVIDAALLKQKYLQLTGEDFGYLITQDITQTICKRCGLIFFDPMITGDENFYMELQKFDWYYMDNKEEFQYAKKYIRNTDSVLEIGAGKGAFAKMLSTKDYTGLDFSAHAKEMANVNGVHIINESIEDHAQKNPGKYDVVCSFQVLEHVADPHGLIASKVQALKKNGLMIVAVPSDDSYLKYESNNILNLPPHHISKWTDKTLEYITKLFDLQLIGHYHEKPAEIHRKCSLSTMIQRIFLKPKFIDDTLTRKVIAKFSSLLAFLLINILSRNFLSYGHTVVAVYKKTGST